jgi:hypothetical protein
MYKIPPSYYLKRMMKASTPEEWTVAYWGFVNLMQRRFLNLTTKYIEGYGKATENIRNW